MQCLGHEIVPFEDVCCQLFDLLKLGTHVSSVTFKDLVKREIISIGGIFFDLLLNLNKFVQFEQRDPFAERQRKSENFETEWDRFAYLDYARLAAEDDRDRRQHSDYWRSLDWLDPGHLDGNNVDMEVDGDDRRERDEDSSDDNDSSPFALSTFQEAPF